jgi:hypothetical protein
MWTMTTLESVFLVALSMSVTSGGEAIPCKDWPSATASGGCGLDKGLPPDLVCHQ